MAVFQVRIGQAGCAWPRRGTLEVVEDRILLSQGDEVLADAETQAVSLRRSVSSLGTEITIWVDDAVYQLDFTSDGVRWPLLSLLPLSGEKQTVKSGQRSAGRCAKAIRASGKQALSASRSGSNAAE